MSRRPVTELEAEAVARLLDNMLVELSGHDLSINQQNRVHPWYRTHANKDGLIRVCR